MSITDLRPLFSISYIGLKHGKEPQGKRTEADLASPRARIALPWGRARAVIKLGTHRDGRTINSWRSDIVKIYQHHLIIIYKL